MLLRHFLILGLLLTTGIHADISQEKKDAIYNYIQVTGATKSAHTIQKHLNQQYSDSYIDLNNHSKQEAAVIIAEEVGFIFTDQLTNKNSDFYKMIYRIYDRYFTLEELQSLITFYESDLGKKLANTMPIITEDMIIESQRWMQSLQPEIDSNIKARLEK